MIIASVRFVHVVLYSNNQFTLIAYGASLCEYWTLIIHSSTGESFHSFSFYLMPAELAQHPSARLW